MANIVKTKNGKKFVLLDPSEKAKRYARQLKKGCVNETGKVLTDADRSYRAGYLDARSDSAKAYCANNGIPSKAKPKPRKKRTHKSDNTYRDMVSGKLSSGAPLTLSERLWADQYLK